MEQLNKIELRGKVGNVRISRVGENVVANFSLATNYVYMSKDGQPVVETTWHTVVAWDGKGMPDLTKIDKGSSLYVCGRLRNTRYTSSDGTEKQAMEVIANAVSFEEVTNMQTGF
jgi:single-strand DNA-binding protein